MKFAHLSIDNFQILLSILCVYYINYPILYIDDANNKNFINVIHNIQILTLIEKLKKFITSQI
jgi:hypothetical protein